MENSETTLQEMRKVFSEIKKKLPEELSAWEKNGSIRKNLKWLAQRLRAMIHIVMQPARGKSWQDEVFKKFFELEYGRILLGKQEDSPIQEILNKKNNDYGGECCVPVFEGFKEESWFTKEILTALHLQYRHQISFLSQQLNERIKVGDLFEAYKFAWTLFSYRNAVLSGKEGRKLEKEQMVFRCGNCEEEIGVGTLGQGSKIIRCPKCNVDFDLPLIVAKCKLSSCGKIFLPEDVDRNFCSTDCQQKHYELTGR